MCSHTTAANIQYIDPYTRLHPHLCVLYSESGCGKTALLSKCIADFVEAREDTHKVILRFLGTSAATTSAKSLLIDLW